MIPHPSTMIAVQESRTRELNAEIARNRRATLALRVASSTAATGSPGLGRRFAVFGGRLRSLSGPDWATRQRIDRAGGALRLSPFAPRVPRSRGER